MSADGERGLRTILSLTLGGYQYIVVTVYRRINVCKHLLSCFGIRKQSNGHHYRIIEMNSVSELDRLLISQLQLENTYKGLKAQSMCITIDPKSNHYCIVIHYRKWLCILIYLLRNYHSFYIASFCFASFNFSDCKQRLFKTSIIVCSTSYNFTICSNMFQNPFFFFFFFIYWSNISLSSYFTYLAHKIDAFKWFHMIYFFCTFYFEDLYCTIIIILFI